jgi:asparagine synthase (glutamine-hydrolysing)
MCGIVGYLDPAARFATSAAALAHLAQRMASTLEHRGPDHHSVWSDASSGIALGFRRLAIVDLSPEGRQPMVSAGQRYTIVFNGEIYNHGELQAELASKTGVSFRGHSDTEVLLAAIEHWGLEEALRRSVGMFAIALWDRQKLQLTLARDRMGEKPLYYGWLGQAFVFASELKAMRLHPAWRDRIDRNVLALYLRHGYVPGPYSIYKDVFKLPPGTTLTVSRESNSQPVPRAYWSPSAAIDEARRHPFQGTLQQATDQLELLLRDAVRLQMQADVPLGAFLSGGIDSSLVVALMQAQSHRPVKTFSIGFEEPEYDESRHAAAVARHLGTDHTEMRVSALDAMATIPRLPAVYDEPFGDSSQIPTLLVAELARRHVTVTLSGDGGDELFFGYSRYFRNQRAWRYLSRVPLTARRLGSRIVGAVPNAVWDAAGKWGVRAGMMRATRVSSLHARRFAELLQHQTMPALYRDSVSAWHNPESVVAGSAEPAYVLTSGDRCMRSLGPEQYMQYADQLSYLPDDILVKVDRATMAVSLEGRMPLLDHRVVEFAWRLPQEFKYQQGRGKLILRNVLQRYLPAQLYERPKMGFGVPLDRWLRHGLRDWGEELLSQRRLTQDGFFDSQKIRSAWMGHLAGTRQEQFRLWNVLMFQAWHDAAKSSEIPLRAAA